MRVKNFYKIIILSSLLSFVSVAFHFFFFVTKDNTMEIKISPVYNTFKNDSNYDLYLHKFTRYALFSISSSTINEYKSIMLDKSFLCGTKDFDLESKYKFFDNKGWVLSMKVKSKSSDASSCLTYNYIKYVFKLGRIFPLEEFTANKCNILNLLSTYESPPVKLISIDFKVQNASKIKLYFIHLLTFFSVLYFLRNLLNFK